MSPRAVERLDAFQRRHDWIGFPLAVVYKFYDDQGTYLSAMITYYGFLSLFPLMLLLVTTLGFVLHDNPHLQARVLQSALAQFPVIGDQLRNNIKSVHGSGPGLLVGIAGTIYGGLGVAQAVQNAFNRAWAVPRNERPNPIVSRLRSLLLLVVIGLGVLATTVLSALSTGASAYGADLSTGVRLAGPVLSVAVNVLLLLLAFRVATAREVSTRDIWVGAVTAAVAWQALQILGTYYVAHKLRGATAVYGLFGMVLGLLAWIYLEAVILVLSTEINVVRRDNLWPRALLTPLTDDVDLTTADKDAYASYAASERFKGNEQVDVRFHHREGRDPGGSNAEPEGAPDGAAASEADRPADGRPEPGTDRETDNHSGAPMDQEGAAGTDHGREHQIETDTTRDRPAAGEPDSAAAGDGPRP